MNEMAIPPHSRRMHKVVNLCISLYFWVFVFVLFLNGLFPLWAWSFGLLTIANFPTWGKTFVSDKQEKMMRGNKGNDHMMRIMLMLMIMLMLVSMKLSMITWGGGLRSWTPIFVFPGSSLDYNIIIYFDYITITRSTSSRSEDTLIQVRRSSEMPLSANNIRIRIRRWTLKLWL